MIKFLERVDEVAQRLSDQHWAPRVERVLRHVDRYFRTGRHHDRPGSVSGWELVARQGRRPVALTKVKRNPSWNDDTVVFATWMSAYGS